MIPLLKQNNKYTNNLVQLKRIKAWWYLLMAKHDKAAVEKTFEIPFTAIASATADGQLCNCTSPSPPADALTAYNQLKNCTATAAEACDYTTITYTKQDPDCSTCGTQSCVNSPSSCDTPTCTNCTTTDNDCTLTQAMVSHISGVCIPQIEAWLRRYRVSRQLVQIFIMLIILLISVMF